MSGKKISSSEAWDLDSFREPLGHAGRFPSFSVSTCEMSFVKKLTSARRKLLGIHKPQFPHL